MQDTPPVVITDADGNLIPCRKNTDCYGKLDVKSIAGMGYQQSLSSPLALCFLIFVSVRFALQRDKDKKNIKPREMFNSGYQPQILT